MEPLVYPRFLFVKDDFYDDPDKVYRAAQQATYHEPEHYTGFRSTTVYHEPKVRAKLERLLGVKITRWDTDPADENGVFYQAFANGKYKEAVATANESMAMAQAEKDASYVGMNKTRIEEWSTKAR